MTKEEAIVAMIQGKSVISNDHVFICVYKYIDGKFYLNDTVIDVNNMCKNGFELYKEPKKKVKKCLWIVKSKNLDMISLTTVFYNVDAKVNPCPGQEIIGPALWSEIEVDE